MDQNDEIPPITGRRVAGEPAEGEAGHFEICPGCGQAVDRRDLRQVMHHGTPGHAPEKRS